MDDLPFRRMFAYASAAVVVGGCAVLACIEAPANDLSAIFALTAATLIGVGVPLVVVLGWWRARARRAGVVGYFLRRRFQRARNLEPLAAR